MKRRSIDKVYVQRLQEGDMEALSYIYEWYKNSIYYFALTITENAFDAEEVVQETFINVMHSAKNIKNVEAFHSWLFSIAYNNSKNVYRKKQPTVELQDETNIEEIFSSDAKQQTEIEKKELHAAIQKELEELPSKFNSVGQLRYVEGLSIAEISKVLKIPTGTVKTRLQKVRRIVQPKLEEKGFSPNIYFSFGGIYLFEVYSNMMQANPMPDESAALVKESVVAAASGVGVVGTIAEQTISKAFKVGLASLILAGGVCSGIVYYGLNMKTDPNIVEIAYNEELTNKDVLVNVQLDRKINDDDYQVLHDGKVVSANRKNEKISFSANTNGEYEVRVGKQKQTITIHNIDKEGPSILNIAYDTNKVKINYEANDIDYNRSGIYQDGKLYNMNAQGEIDVNSILGDVSIFLYDKAGNFVEYAATIESEK